MIKFWRLRTTCIFLSCRFLAGCIARSLGEPRAGKPANSPAGAISRRRGPQNPRRFFFRLPASESPLLIPSVELIARLWYHTRPWPPLHPVCTSRQKGERRGGGGPSSRPSSRHFTPHSC